MHNSSISDCKHQFNCLDNSTNAINVATSNTKAELLCNSLEEFESCRSDSGPKSSLVDVEMNGKRRGVKGAADVEMNTAVYFCLVVMEAVVSTGASTSRDGLWP